MAILSSKCLQEVYYKHTYDDNAALSFQRQPADYTAEQLAILKDIASAKKTVLMVEYMEKNRDICAFYKKCYISGYSCAVYDWNSSDSPARECFSESEKV